MTSDRFYITTPIYYATGAPHLGHAYTTILGDTIARYHRQSGRPVFFLTGTDEHGQKMQEEAARRGVEPLALADEMADAFKWAWTELDISHDRFIRTTEPEHVAVVRAAYQRLWDRGDIYAGEYRGWYCVHEERYWTEKDLGPDRTCPDCRRPVQLIEETNYFFRMSRYRDRLLAHIRDNPRWIVPEARRNEVLSFLAKPLEDLSVSRPRSRVGWGIGLPFDDGHVAYVWMDALFNYVTASGVLDASQPADQQGFGMDTSHSWWPANLHLIGKDILTTHCVYWPTFLMAAELPLPRQVLAHGWWVAGDTKMSKSLGNVVDPLALRSQFGTDAVRWYLLREMPTGSDASYTPERFLVRYEELANVLGNLVHRVTSMIIKYRGGAVPSGSGNDLDLAVGDTLVSYESNMEALRLHDAFAAVMDLARAANGFIEEREPWILAKDPEKAGELDQTLHSLVRTLVVITALFEPVMPERTVALASRLGLDSVPTIREARHVDLDGRTVEKGSALFPRHDVDAA